MQQHQILSLGLLTSHLIQVRTWIVSTGPSVFTGIENVRSEPTNRRSRTSANTVWVRARLCKLQKRCTWLAAASDKVNQLLARHLWLSLASSITKTGRCDIAESGVKHNTVLDSKQADKKIIITENNDFKQEY